MNNNTGRPSNLNNCMLQCLFGLTRFVFLYQCISYRIRFSLSCSLSLLLFSSAFLFFFSYWHSNSPFSFPPVNISEVVLKDSFLLNSIQTCGSEGLRLMSFGKICIWKDTNRLFTFRKGHFYLCMNPLLSLFWLLSHKCIRN